MEFKKLNDVSGWIIFIIALITYTLTVEPTASFWDCGEFIAASYKLQVPHPPGAPLFLLIGRIFSLFASSPEKVAFMVNMVSVLSSAFGILFLFWTITMIARKLVKSEFDEPTISQKIGIIGSGVVGALACTFSDSYWFSAVEAEVYAISAFFTAFVFWAILKWERIKDDREGDKWLLLIAYVMGLSIGAHLLNLVAIPALAYVFYYKKYSKATPVGMVVTFLISLVLVLIIMEGVIPGLPSIAGKFEIYFVNSLGLPYNVGIIFFMTAFIGGLIYAIHYSIKSANRLLNTVLLCFTFILIGYTSYGIILIRSMYNPPLDENNPENVISFVSYLKREQYGDRPLFFGPQYTAELINQEKTAPMYRKKDDKYVIYDYKTKNTFDAAHETLLPRMYSKQPSHIEEYAKIVGEPKLSVRSYNDEMMPKPSFGQNLKYMFVHQFGNQYFRYFMWNFSGRESDIQGAGALTPFDSSDSDLPDSLKNNKARNNFWGIPLILGVLGLFFHLYNEKKSFISTFLFFLFTGLALSFYLNQPPIEPRERDYIFAGSFYVFAIWIGLGVLALSEYLTKIIKSEFSRIGVSVALSLSAPAVMALQGWDDHNRSGRYLAVDSAKNLLNSCAKNAILFTGGDNDTFPLWYVQEVEGFRTDVRVCNLSLLNTDWYIQQMKDAAYDSEPLPISFEFDQFIQGKNDYVPYYEKPEVANGIFVKDYIEAIRKENSNLVSVRTQSGDKINCLPTDKLILPVDTAAVLALGIIPESQKKNIVSTINWSVGKNSLEKKDLIILDMIVNSNWKRPIYFSTTLSNSNYLNLREYMQMEGLAFRLLPVFEAGASQGRVEADIMYNNLVKKTFWRNMDDEKVYYDENCRRFPLNARHSFYRLALQYFIEGNKVKAKEVIDYSLKVMPDKTIPFDFYTVGFIGLLLDLGNDKDAMAISNAMFKKASDEVAYSLKVENSGSEDTQMNMYVMSQIIDTLKNKKRNAEAAQFEKIFSQYMNYIK